jgi:hypothetical protein
MTYKIVRFDGYVEEATFPEPVQPGQMDHSDTPLPFS